MPDVDFRGALNAALDEELERDERVILFGEDIAQAGGVFQVTPGLQARHGADRVFDTPISELAISGAAFGSAACGLRPVIEIMFADFICLAMDSLVNQAAKYWFISNEQACVPLVVRTSTGAGGRFGAMHSQVPARWFVGVPGVKVVAPSTPADARGLLKAAIRDDNPVVFLEHKRLYAMKGEVDLDADGVVALGCAAIRREGDDLTIVSAMKSMHDCLAAADRLAADHGIEAEVIDLRTLRPLDLDAIAGSVARTNRLLVVEEGPRTGGWAGEILATITERSLEDLDDAWRLATDDVPIPYSPPLEDAHLPGVDAIVGSILERHG